MNTGVTEAHNLAWKLAAMVNGWGGSRLMESYEAERLPVARRNRDHVRKCASAVIESQFDAADVRLGDSPSDRATRDGMAARFESKVSRLYESLGIEIGYRYRNVSTIVCDEQDEPPSDEVRYRATTWPGARLPNGFGADGVALLDRIPADSFVLFVADARRDDVQALVDAAQAVRLPLTLSLIHLPEPTRRPC
ncbi:FAD-dependent monooxygenase, partial [Burkholderia pseudomallei]|uniref:FAD-dependent monooxygenase n=1 Tax=Burkholderia pseudomallei TaxID=28450 RepID=UPI0021F76BC7